MSEFKRMVFLINGNKELAEMLLNILYSFDYSWFSKEIGGNALKFIHDWKYLLTDKEGGLSWSTDSLGDSPDLIKLGDLSDKEDIKLRILRANPGCQENSYEYGIWDIIQDIVEGGKLFENKANLLILGFSKGQLTWFNRSGEVSHQYDFTTDSFRSYREFTPKPEKKVWYRPKYFLNLETLKPHLNLNSSFFESKSDFEKSESIKVLEWEEAEFEIDFKLGDK